MTTALLRRQLLMRRRWGLAAGLLRSMVGGRAPTVPRPAPLLLSPLPGLHSATLSTPQSSKPSTRCKVECVPLLGWGRQGGEGHGSAGPEVVTESWTLQRLFHLWLVTLDQHRGLIPHTSAHKCMIMRLAPTCVCSNTHTQTHAHDLTHTHVDVCTHTYSTHGRAD